MALDTEKKGHKLITREGKGMFSVSPVRFSENRFSTPQTTFASLFVVFQT